MAGQTNVAEKPRYKRVVLKLSGESFSHAGERGISMEEVSDIARQIQRAQQMGCQSLLYLVQTLINRDIGGRVWVATRGVQAVRAGEDMPGLAQSSLWGFGKVVGLEEPGHWGGLIDLDAHDGCGENLMADEILAPDGEDLVAYRSGQRYVSRLVPEPSRT